MSNDDLKENTENTLKLSLTITFIYRMLWISSHFSVPHIAHPRLPWYREVSRQGPARSRLQKQKRVLGEDFAADWVELLGGGHRGAVNQVRGQ